MSRPGGLTALAVFNFVLSALTALGAMNFVFFIVARNNDELREQMAKSDSSGEVAQFMDLPVGTLVLLTVLTLGVAGLLLLSGLGYMKMKRFMGWWMGMLYVAISVGAAVYQTSVTGDVTVNLLINLVYPIVTAVLLLTTFRRDFFESSGPATKIEAPAGAPVMVSTGRMAHISLIAFGAVRFALRTGGGVIFLVLILFVGLQSSSWLIMQAETAIQGASAGEMIEMVAKRSEDFVTGATGASGDQYDYLMRDHPALLSALFLVFLIIAPFSATVGGFNQTAGDIGTKGLRYMLLRTERPNIYFGRFLGTLMFSFFGMGCLLATVVLYVQFKLDLYEASALWAWAFQGWIGLCIFAMPHLAICAWISGSTSGPFISFAIGTLAISFPLGMLAMTQSIMKTGGNTDVGWILRLLPWGWKYELLEGDLGARLLAMLVMVGFTVVFLWIGYSRFRKRDL